MKRTAPFSKAAKRNAVLAGLFVLPPIGLAVVASMTPDTPKLSSEEKVEQALAANKGTKGLSDYETCLYNKAQTEELLGKGKSKLDCDRVKNWIKPQDRVRMANSQGLVRKCEAQIRPGLKDPGSYRYISHQYVANDSPTGLEVKVTYSATNSFGGRIQNTQTCGYTF